MGFVGPGFAKFANQLICGVRNAEDEVRLAVTYELDTLFLSEFLCEEAGDFAGLRIPAIADYGEAAAGLGTREQMEQDAVGRRAGMNGLGNLRSSHWRGGRTGISAWRGNAAAEEQEQEQTT
jgi:hypothetical protein